MLTASRPKEERNGEPQRPPIARPMIASITGIPEAGTRLFRRSHWLARRASINSAINSTVIEALDGKPSIAVESNYPISRSFHN
jgi:hypothetical protein